LAAKARALLARAARRAASLGSPAEALRHAETALARDPQGSEKHELAELAAANARMSGSTDRAIELAQAARAGYTSEGREMDAVRALIIEAQALREQSRLQQAVDLLTPVYEAMKDREDAQVQLLKLADALSGCHVFLGNHQEAQRYGLHALTLAEAEGDAADIANALYRFSLVLLYLGSPTASRALLLESIRVAREGNLTATLALALNNLASLTYPRDLAAALPYAEEALALNQQIGDRGRAAVSMINVALMHWISGDWQRADALAADWTADELAGSVYTGLELVHALIAWTRGLPVTPPRDYGTELDDSYDRASVAGIGALVAAQSGDLALAARMADEGMRDYHGSYGYEDDLVLFWSLAADLALEAGDLPRLRELLVLSAAAPGGARTPLLLSHAAFYEGLLAAAEGRDPEAQLRDALQRLAAYGAPLRLAQAQLALASWLGAAGREAEGAQLLDDAAAVLTRLGAQPWLQKLAATRQAVRA
ncbi:MAG: hypothetical protein QOE84_3485, partial [Actinomycetota bacterium]|nr:hypothetical protein [Actinomycetota bacterium]